MESLILVIIVATLIVLAIYSYFKARRRNQLNFIKSYRFHSALGKKVMEKYPHLSKEQTNTIFIGLKDYFIFCLLAKKRMVAMPSQAVDVAWHEFILFTRTYEKFCKKGLGRFLHHTPTEAMKGKTLAQESIKRVWRLACTNENINPTSPSKLPLLFAIDSMLNIENGFKYSLNCEDKSSTGYIDTGYCASHIACTSGCGGSSSDFDSSGGFFDGMGSDCGGGGCGGD